MANKKKTFADAAKEIRNKYYKNRKPGEDQMTDDSFNREMKQLQLRQEEVKLSNKESSFNPSKPKLQSLQFSKGGGLPKYDGKDSSFLPYSGSEFLNQKWYIPNADKINPIGIDNVGNVDISSANMGLHISDDFDMNIGDDIVVDNIVEDLPISQFNYRPTANILGPTIGVAGNLLKNHYLKQIAEDKREKLMGLSGIDLGRINPMQIDLGRERANIRSEQAKTAAQGRYGSRNIRSAAERANLTNQARLGSQRIAGNLLSKSYQTEDIENAKLRARANEVNQQLRAREAMEEARQKMAIESQYGDIDKQLAAGLTTSTAQSLQNYLAENQQMRQRYDLMQAMYPDIKPSYYVPDNISEYQRLLYNLGIKQPSRNMTV